MMDRLDAAERLEFLASPGAFGIVLRSKVAEHKFDGFEQAAGGLGFPNFAEAAAAQALDKPVACNRFGVGLNPHRHGDSLGRPYSIQGKLSSQPGSPQMSSQENFVAL